MINKLISQNLKFLRERERKSMARLAKLIDVDMQKIANMEYGKSIKIETLVKLSDFYEISIDRIAREDLSKTDIIISKVDINLLKTNKVLSKNDTPTISKNDIPINENIGKALDCAKTMNFNCYFYNEKKVQFDFCKDCFKAEFWSKKDLALDLANSSVEDVIPQGIDYLSCDMFQMNPSANCYLRNIQRANLPKCYECLRDINRWGCLAIGYKKE